MVSSHQTSYKDLSQQENGSIDEKNMKVTFDEEVFERSTLSLDDYTEDEIERCWLTDHEMQKTLDRVAKVAMRMAYGKKPKRGSSYRGLENATVQGESEYFLKIQDVIESVLAEQDRQDRFNIYDEELIAEASELYTELSMAQAWRRAKSDAREARKAYRQMEDIHYPCNEGSNSSISYYDEEPVPILRTGNDLGHKNDEDITFTKLQKPIKAVC